MLDGDDCQVIIIQASRFGRSRPPLRGRSAVWVLGSAAPTRIAAGRCGAITLSHALASLQGRSASPGPRNPASLATLAPDCPCHCSQARPQDCRGLGVGCPAPGETGGSRRARLATAGQVLRQTPASLQGPICCLVARSMLRDACSCVTTTMIAVLPCPADTSRGSGTWPHGPSAAAGMRPAAGNV